MTTTVEPSAAPPSSAGSGVAASPVRRHGGVFSALRETSYAVYWSGLIIYVVGWKFEEIAYGWLIWALTQDPLWLGYLALANGVPLVLFQLFGGVMADRVDRMRLLLSTQAMTGAILAIAAGLTLTGVIRPEHVLVLAAASGLFRSFEQPTRMALIPHIISRDNLPNAIAIGSMPWQAGRIIAPSLGGVLIATAGPGAGLALGAVAYFAAIGLYSRVRLHGPGRGGATKTILRDLVEGITYVRGEPVALALIVLTFFIATFGLSYVAILPAFADAAFGAGAQGFGFLQGSAGIGAVLGTVVLAWIANRMEHRGVLMLAGSLVFGALLMLMSQAPLFAVALAAIFGMGFANTFYLTTVNTVVQQRVPDTLRGRVLGIFGLTWNLIPLGGIFVGGVAALLDTRSALLAGGLFVVAAAVAMLLFAPRLRRLE